MEKEYDFSNGERGKFYNKNAVFHMPIYLEPEIESFIEKLAREFYCKPLFGFGAFSVGKSKDIDRLPLFR